MKIIWERKIFCLKNVVFLRVAKCLNDSLEGTFGIHTVDDFVEEALFFKIVLEERFKGQA